MTASPSGQVEREVALVAGNIPGAVGQLRRSEGKLSTRSLFLIRPRGSGQNSTAGITQ